MDLLAATEPKEVVAIVRSVMTTVTEPSQERCLEDLPDPGKSKVFASHASTQTLDPSENRFIRTQLAHIFFSFCFLFLFFFYDSLHR